MWAPNIMRSLFVAVLLCGISLAATSSPAFAATPATVYEPLRVESPNPEANGRFGEVGASAGDIDGDGVGDFWMSAFQQTVADVPLAGRVYLISGRTRASIYSVASPEPQREHRFGGLSVDSPGDLTGDGKADLVVSAEGHDDFRGESSPGVPDSDPCGAPEPNGCYENTGQAWVYNGATGSLLYSLENPQPQSNPEQPGFFNFAFGTSLSGVGDLTGDGRPEVLVGAPNNDVPRGCGGQAVPVPSAAPPGCHRDQGQAFVFNGATGVLLRTYDIPASDVRPESCAQNAPGPGIGTCGLLGRTVQGVGDTDGDGVIDHLLAAVTYGDNKAGRMYVFSGRTGQRLLTIANPMPARDPLGQTGGRIFGLQFIAEGVPGDVNGDGSADIYGLAFQSPGLTGLPGDGRAWIFSGRDGSILYNLSDPSPEQSGNFGYSIVGTDYDLDGTADELITGQNSSGFGATASGGGATVFGVPATFGPTVNAPALKDFQPPVEDRQPVEPAPANGLRFGRTVVAPGDLNGDCHPDYAIGAPHFDAGGNVDQGRVYVELSTGPSGCPTASPGVDVTRPPSVGTTPQPPTAPVLRVPAKLQVDRALVRAGRLQVTVRTNALASGRLTFRFLAAGKTLAFSQTISRGTVRVSRQLAGALARSGTGILTVTYAGDARVRPESLRLRAASRSAALASRSARILGGKLQVSGTISRAARGAVRARLTYDVGGDPRVVTYSARITRGRWRLEQKLPVPAARAGGQLSISYAGFGNIAGAQIQKTVAPGR